MNINLIFWYIWTTWTTEYDAVIEMQFKLICFIENVRTDLRI